MVSGGGREGARMLSRGPECVSVLQGEVLIQEPHHRSPAELLLPISLPQNHSGHRGKLGGGGGVKRFLTVRSSVCVVRSVRVKRHVMERETPRGIIFRFAGMKPEMCFL